ncbi:zinc finger protein 107-like [Hetaerina americana]|uniref:zinc finger protein 107-like n=1 Tax=Hetaerina americana TaxID=62018 RepID=UPI003A7F44A4
MRKEIEDETIASNAVDGSEVDVQDDMIIVKEEIDTTSGCSVHLKIDTGSSMQEGYSHWLVNEDSSHLRKIDLASHIKLVHALKKKHQCEFCSKNFPYLSKLKIHMLTHTRKRPFQCALCLKGFAGKIHLKKHMLTHTDRREHICEICSKVFTCIGTLKRHVLTHTGDRPYKCRICHNTFTRNFTLKTHMLTHTGDKPHKCQLCLKAFTVKSHLKSHILTHTGEKPYKCRICQKTFTHSSSLKSHMLTHTGEKPYKCRICQKTFTQRHMLTHTGEKPHRCEICSKGFALNSSLKRHMLTHTDGKKYKCDVCLKAFAYKCFLKDHILKHTDQRPHKCNICSKAFTQRSHLKSHMITHSGIAENATASDAEENKAVNVWNDMILVNEEVDTCSSCSAAPEKDVHRPCPHTELLDAEEASASVGACLANLKAFRGTRVPVPPNVPAQEEVPQPRKVADRGQVRQMEEGQDRDMGCCHLSEEDPVALLSKAPIMETLLETLKKTPGSPLPSSQGPSKGGPCDGMASTAEMHHYKLRHVLSSLYTHLHLSIKESAGEMIIFEEISDDTQGKSEEEEKRGNGKLLEVSEDSLEVMGIVSSTPYQAPQDKLISGSNVFKVGQEQLLSSSTLGFSHLAHTDSSVMELSWSEELVLMISESEVWRRQAGTPCPQTQFLDAEEASAAAGACQTSLRPGRVPGCRFPPRCLPRRKHPRQGRWLMGVKRESMEILLGILKKTPGSPPSTSQGLSKGGPGDAMASTAEMHHYKLRHVLFSLYTHLHLSIKESAGEMIIFEEISDDTQGKSEEEEEEKRGNGKNNEMAPQEELIPGTNLLKLGQEQLLSSSTLDPSHLVHKDSSVMHVHLRKVMLFRCDVCLEVFKRKYDLASHIKLVHALKKKHQCDFCSKNFLNFSKLKIHMSTHTGERPFQCALCLKVLAGKILLQRHMLTHTVERPHRCEICSKTFIAKSHLKRHMLTHTGEKHHKCNICSKPFARNSCLKGHMLTHTGEKPHKCTICLKPFTLRSNLKSHMKTHTGKKPHQCHICSKAFAARSSLKCHMMTHTGEEPHKCRDVELPMLKLIQADWSSNGEAENLGIEASSFKESAKKAMTSEEISDDTQGGSEEEEEEKRGNGKLLEVSEDSLEVMGIVSSTPYQ